MTSEEMASIKLRLDAARATRDEIRELKDRISCIEQNMAGFRFECGGGGRWLGDSPGLQNVIIAELQRQLGELEAKFAAL